MVVKFKTVDGALNILVLGETGVGKSTWINAFANYLRFETLEEAMQNEPVCLIPSKFTITDENYDTKTIDFGNRDNEKNESTVDGQSATQESLAHLFTTPHGKIRIIDTPGIGDTRGPLVDQENFENVLRYISQLPQLHGICILLKSNMARLTVTFRYCINELLTHLHRSAATNIVFCFTNSRAAFFKPGETLKTLRTFLKELETDHGVNIPTTSDTMFCLDNEAFRFLLAHKSGIEFAPEDHDDYSQSWSRSQKETGKLLKRVKQLPAHRLQETVTINNTRRIILTLAKPLSEITSNIQLNKKLLQDHTEGLKKHDGDYADLVTKLKVTQVTIQTVPLGHPRTVCTASHHVDTVFIPNTTAKQTIYRTHCHTRCYLSNVEKEKLPNPALRGCSAMSSTNTCTKCGCDWTLHMHVDFEQKQVSDQKEDPLVQDAMKKNTEAKELLQIALAASKKKSLELEAEHKKIMAYGAKFGAFLQANAIKPYNDAIEAYLEYSMKEEERLIASGKTDGQKMENLKANLSLYQEQKKILDETTKDGAETTLSPEEVLKLVHELKRLPHSGAEFRRLFEAHVIGEDLNFVFTEKQYCPTGNGDPSSGLGLLKGIKNLFV